MRSLNFLALALGLLLVSSAAFSAAPVTELNTNLNNQNNNNSGLTAAQQLTAQNNQIQYIQSELAALNSMQASIADLRDQNEQLAHRVSALEAQIQALIPAKPAATPAATTPVAAAISPAISPAVVPVSSSIKTASTQTEGQAYQQSYNLIALNRYDDAITGFNKFLTQYPQGRRAADANYWLGQLYMLKGQPDQATQEFRKVLTFKTSSKIPDSLRQLGLIYQANGDSAHAKQMFQRVVKEYPGTAAATAAQKQIDSMN